MHLFDEMYKGKIKGLFAVGTDPAVSSPNTTKVRKALENLDWLVGENIFDNETYCFWKGPGVDPAKVKTEVFLLPASASMEKEGSQSNSGRWVQWKYKAAEAPDDAIPVGEITIKILDAVRALYAKEGGVHPEPILNVKWDYKDSKGRFDSLKVAKQINGYFLKDTVIEDKAKGTKTEFKKGQLVPTFGMLADDGSTVERKLGHGRELRRRRQQQDGQARQGGPHGPRSLPQLVLCLAGESPHPLQPGLLRSQRKAIQPQEKAARVDR